ncbi:MAG TPA: PQQ-binding-like beta-propeller repeat protein [bacterium]|nr:PQQ-binding-like beta-propeller repeat protein [bacterium]
MKRASTTSLLLLAMACFAFVASSAFGQGITGGAWPTLHFDYENKRGTFEEGPPLSSQNLTIHWSYEAGYSRSNHIIDSNGRIYCLGTIDGAMGTITALYCINEGLPDEEGCTLPELLWQSLMGAYPNGTWNTGALSPDETRFYFAGRGTGGLALDCYDPNGDPDNMGNALLLFSTPFLGGGSDASDIMIDTNDQRIYVFGNSAGSSVGYGFSIHAFGDFDEGSLVWLYGMDPQTPLGADVCASPALCSSQYTYWDYTPGQAAGGGTYWMGLGQPRTIYAPGADGNLYAMHTIAATTWSPPPILFPPPPPPLGDPAPVNLKWSYEVSSAGSPLVSSPVIVPRMWNFQKDRVEGTPPPDAPAGTPPPVMYNNVGVTTSTIYICDPAGTLLCLEDSWYAEHDWEFLGWSADDPPAPMWQDNNDEYIMGPDIPPPGIAVGAFPRKYTSALRWSYDLGGPTASTPILAGNAIYVQSDHSLHGVDIMTGMDVATNYFGATEGMGLWETSCSADQPPGEWNFTPDGSYEVAPSPAMDGNGLIWMMTSDGWLEVVTSTNNDLMGYLAGDVVFEYHTDSEENHRGLEKVPFHEQVYPHRYMTIACSPIISGGYIYIRGDGRNEDEVSGDLYGTGWVMKIKENVVGRFRFADVDPKVGYTEENRMARLPTVFTYDVDYFDPDCGSVGVYDDEVPHPENPIILYVDGFHTFWRFLEDPFQQYPPYHIDPDNPNRAARPTSLVGPPYGLWEGMIYQLDTGDDDRRLGTYEYISDGSVAAPSLREYIYYNQNGCFNYFFETEDGFGANSPIVSEVYGGPNMCPELYFVKTDVTFDGTISRPKKSVVDLWVWYYDSDEDSPRAREVYLDNIAYTMGGDSVIGNSSVPWEDRYSFHMTTTNDTPSFHFEFTDAPTAVHPDWPRDEVEPCTTRLPEYGQLFTLLLRNGKVTPAVGPPGAYTYSIRFFDPKRRSSGINTGDVGSLNAHMYIDDVQYDMELLPGNGSQFDGLYTYETVYLDYGEHSFWFDFYYEGQMPFYNEPRSRGVLTSDPGNADVERNPPPSIARATAPEFQYVGPTIAKWPSFNRYQDNNSLENEAFGPTMPVMDTLNIGEPVKGTPVIGGSESTIFAGSRDGRVYAIASDFSHVLWQYDTGDYVDCTPALGQEGSIIVASRSGTVFALDTWTGELRWIFSAADIADSSPCVGVNGDVYIGSYSGTFYSIKGRDGTLKWSYNLPTRGAVQCSAAEGTDSTVYFGSYDNYVYAVNSGGLLVWTYETGGMVNSSPSVETNGNVDTVYIGSFDHCLYRLDYDFTVAGFEPMMVWKYDTGAPVQYSSPAIDGHYVYLASDALYAIDKDTGELGWSFVPGGSIFGSITVDSAGVVYFGASDAKLYAVRAPTDPDFVARKEGELAWWENVGSQVWISGVSIAPLGSVGSEGYGTSQYDEGQLFFGCWDGNIYRIANRSFNTPPVLTDPSVSPSIGGSDQSFRFGVHFFDADGDEPLDASVYIDDEAHDMMFTGVGVPSNGGYEYYTDFTLSKGEHTYYFEFTDGNWVGNTPVLLPAAAPEGQFSGPIIDNKPDLTNPGVDPVYGDFSQEFVLSVDFSDPDDDPPVSAVVYIDGKAHALSEPTGEGQTPFNGTYTYTTTGAELGVGDHTYHFEFEYSVNEWVKGPVVGELSDLTVNNSPVLADGTVTPEGGDTSDDYTYSVHYKDIDDQPPARANVVIDGVPHQMSLYSDFDSDGTYRYTMAGELMGYGSHIYYFGFEDTASGATMLPAPPLEPFHGPQVNAIPTLLVGHVSPISGDSDVDFVFSVHFADPDGVRPSEVALVLDGTRYDLILEEGIITDGLYARTISGTQIGLGDDHSFYFEATDDDGSSTRFPEDASESISGPAIVEPGIYIPYWQVRNSTGQDTTLVIGNAGTSQLSSSVDVVVHLYAGLLGMEIDTISHTIAPGEQVKVDLSERFDDQLSHFGCAKVTWDRGSIAVWAMTKNAESQAVSMTLKDPQIRSSYLPYWQVSSDSTIDTLLAISNIGGTSVDLHVDFYDFDGNSVGATTFTIQPRVLRPLWLSDVINDAESAGSAVLIWERGILALWGMIMSEDTSKAFEVSFNQPFSLSADLPYWALQSGGSGRSGLAKINLEMPRFSDGLGDNVSRLVVGSLSGKKGKPVDLDAIREAAHNGSALSSGSLAVGARSWTAETKSADKAPPVLSGFAISPEAPTTLDAVTFSIDYYDEDGDLPLFALVVIDDDNRGMTLEEGQPYDGRYSYQTFLTAGVHRFYFMFSDGEMIVQLPEGTHFTINVTGASQQLDTWLVVTNLTESAGPAIVSLFDLNGNVVGAIQTQLGGLYSSGMLKLSETPVMQGIGSGTISIGAANPLLNVWGVIQSDTFNTGFAINFESRHSRSMFIPYWSINDEYGVDSWVSVTNKGDENGIVVVNLFDNMGELVGIADHEIAPNSMWFMDARDILFSSATKINGRGTVIWEEGQYLLYGAITDLTNRTSYPLAFVQPQVHK